MKMNKIIIPAAALAMGIALVGSVSSTLAWYQYSTKAQAAFIGTSIGQSENLEILLADGVTWKTNLTSTDVNALASATGQHPVLLPVTPGKSVAKTGNDDASALPAKTAFKNGVETGKNGYRDGYAESVNIIQFDLKIRYKKIDSNETYLDKYLKLSDLTIMENSTAASSKGDLYKAIRVHFAVKDGNNYLFANDENSNDEELVTQTYGSLDTDNDGNFDKILDYEWSTNNGTVVYGIQDTNETAYNAHALNLGNNPHQLCQLGDDEDGTTITVTIWIEGWQKLAGLPDGNRDGAGEGNHISSMWDPTVYTGKKFNVGMRFQALDA